MREPTGKPDDSKDCCQSEKPRELGRFEDAPIEEKIKRLHMVLSDIRRSLHWVHDSQSALATKIYALEHHQHSEKGDCMIRIEDTNRGQNASIYGGIASQIDLLA